MLRNRMFFVLGLLVVASMILTACGGAATPAATEAPAVAPATQAPEVVPTEAPITPTSYTTPPHSW
jgi:ABC-type glycerol-3-phosphate transport system substrate-binding protein